MINYYALLTQIRNKIAEIDTFKSVKLGLEKGLNAKDCPFARVVPKRNYREGIYETLEFEVVIGFDIKNKDLESVYEAYYNAEAQIKEKMREINQCFFVETITDEDTLNYLKSAILIFELRNINANNCN